MAKEKTQADVELARIKADLERSKHIWDVVRWGVGWFFATIMVGIIAWAIVRMTDRPAWLTLALALLGAVGGSSWVCWRVAVRLAGRAADVVATAADPEAGAVDREAGGDA